MKSVNRHSQAQKAALRHLACIVAETWGRCLDPGPLAPSGNTIQKLPRVMKSLLSFLLVIVSTSVGDT